MSSVYFGNLRKAVSLPAPKSGLEATAFGRVEKLELANGGSFISQSTATHQEYEMSWGVTEDTLLNPLYEFRKGLWGTGLLYYCDPYLSNALPTHWAEPALSAGGWPSLYAAGLDPVLTQVGTVRTNLARDPAATSGTLVDGALGWQARWYGVGGAGTTTNQTGKTDGPLPYITSYLRKTWTTAPTNAGDTGFGHSKGDASTGTVTTGYPVTAGSTYAISSHLRAVWSGGARAARISVYWRNAAGAYLSTNDSASVALVSGEWVRISGVFTAPTGAVSMGVNTDPDTGPIWAVGDTLDGTGLLVEASPTVGSYFDGNATYVSGSVATWTGNKNASTSTLTSPVYGMPAFGATYALTAPRTETFPSRAAVLLVPPTKTLWVGFSGDATGGAGVYARIIGVDGSIGVPQPLTLLSAGGSTRLNKSFSGSTVSAVVIYLDTTLVGSSTITLISGTAVYSDTGVTPTLTGDHTPGQGHTGLRFQSDPVKTQVMQRGGKNLITAGISLTEIGAWL
jgi:hypothetical protein